MTSAIDPSRPVQGTATTQSVRDNFFAAKTEIEALQAEIEALKAGASLSTPTEMSIALPNNPANSHYYPAAVSVPFSDPAPTWITVTRTGANNFFYTPSFDVGAVPARFYKEIYVDFRTVGALRLRSGRGTWDRGMGMADVFEFYSNGTALHDNWRFADTNEMAMKSDVVGQLEGVVKRYLINSVQRKVAYGGRSMFRHPLQGPGNLAVYQRLAAYQGEASYGSSRTVAEAQGRLVDLSHTQPGGRFPEIRQESAQRMKRWNWTAYAAGRQVGNNIVRIVAEGFTVGGISRAIVEVTNFTGTMAHKQGT